MTKTMTIERKPAEFGEVVNKAIEKLGWIMEKANSVENLSEIDFDDLNYIARTAFEAKKLLQSTMVKA